MGIEIERRFLVRDSRAAVTSAAAGRWCRIRQAYFGHVNGLTLRVRTTFDASGHRTGLLTLKGPRRGFCRHEYQRPLPSDEAERWLSSVPPERLIRKTRYLVHARDGLVWFIDRFEGPNAGLVIAEVELVHARQLFAVPRWIGKEITLDPRYGNSMLARSPIAPQRTARILVSASDRALGNRPGHQKSSSW
jgi:adenylate cyclase